MADQARWSVAILGWLTLVLVCIAAKDAAACSCVGSISGHQPCQARWVYSAVFVGRVVSIEPFTQPIEIGPGRTFDMHQRRVRLAVSEAFSGVTVGETTITTGAGGGDCGFDFSPGREYLVYASAAADGSLGTGICSPTTTV